ncbi:MAG TPA: aminotransferase class I/II-fold pyridoxal phosphate-dependent enzyme, partial [Thermoanaerobaculia bacterium]|nr:aminotransferase class I/II-fold pyridoxal phosphate-dependent enzyme [Thermoanaerobaculia bacterium]
LAERSRRIVETNSALVVAFLARRPELDCVPSDATIAFPRFHDGRDAGSFADRLMRERGVAVVPGRFFDRPSHFRISFGGETVAIEKGLATIGACLEA